MGVGPLRCRPTEWGPDRGVGLVICRTSGPRTSGCRTNIKIPLPAEGPVGVGQKTGCRTTAA